MKQYAIYIGLRDAESREQRFDTEKYRSVLKHVCRSYHTAFSVHAVEGSTRWRADTSTTTGPTSTRRRWC